MVIGIDLHQGISVILAAPPITTRTLRSCPTNNFIPSKESELISWTLIYRGCPSQITVARKTLTT